MNFPNTSFHTQGLGIQPLGYKLSVPNHSVEKKTVSSKKTVRFSPQVSAKKRVHSSGQGGPPPKKRRVAKTVAQSPRKSPAVGKKKAVSGKKTLGHKKKLEAT